MSTPIENFFEQTKDSVDLASAGCPTYTPEMIVTTAYQKMLHMSVFSDGCKEWCRPNAIDKTWTHFNTYFAKYHKDYMGDQATTPTDGFHCTNFDDVQQDASKSLNNLSEALDRIAAP